jgi:hypothetical protein
VSGQRKVRRAGTSDASASARGALRRRITNVTECVRRRDREGDDEGDSQEGEREQRLSGERERVPHGRPVAPRRNPGRTRTARSVAPRHDGGRTGSADRAARAANGPARARARHHRDGAAGRPAGALSVASGCAQTGGCPRSTAAQVDDPFERADTLDGLDRNEPHPAVAAADAERDRPVRIVVVDGALDGGEVPAADHAKAGAPGEPVRGHRALLVERPRAQRLECDLVSPFRSAVGQEPLARTLRGRNDRLGRAGGPAC